MDRRKFIQNSALLSSASMIDYRLFLNRPNTLDSVTILHTNDVHSHIDPFDDNDPKYPGQGGVGRRAALIDTIRKKNKHVLLLDAGDIFQGTPYFNYYKGELEIKLMNLMGYHAATIGNHDFDGGLENLAQRISEAKFPFVNCNYDFSSSTLENKVQPYTIVNMGKIKIGIIGVGIELEGLVPKDLYGNIKYQNPIESINKYSSILKEKEKCNYVIVLSHLGYEYKTTQISDTSMAKELENIDLIIGGHTHTFIEKPTEVVNKQNNTVLVTQAGWAGLILGELSLNFGSKKTVQNNEFSMHEISKKTIG